MSLHDKLLRAVFSGTLDEPLHDAILSQSSIVIAKGTGRLSNRNNGELLLELYVPALPRVADSKRKAGEVLRKNDLLSLEARTQSGFKLKTEHLASGGSDWHSAGYGRMTFKPDVVSLASEMSVPDLPGSVDAIISPCDKLPKNSQSIIRDETPMFGGEDQDLWFYLEMKAAKIGLRKESYGANRLKVWADAEGSRAPLELTEAFLNAVSFRVGSQLHWLAIETMESNAHEIRVRRPGQKLSAFYPPLPLMPPLPQYQQPEVDLIRQATEFFMHPDNRPVYTALAVCWNSQANFFTPQCLLVGAALEGIAKFIIRQELAKKFPKAKSTELDKRLGKITAGQKLKDAAALLNARVSDDEIKAWKAMRNPRAHGEFGLSNTSDAEMQRLMHQRAVAANIVNKLVLGLVGYKGFYRDYSVIGYPTKQFP